MSTGGRYEPTTPRARLLAHLRDLPSLSLSHEERDAMSAALALLDAHDATHVDPAPKEPTR